MAEFLNTPNSELDEKQIKLKEEFQISQGPLSVLQSSIRNHTQILIALRNNKKLLARVKAFDKHSNMVLENVKEMWTEIPKSKNRKPVNKDRFIPKMFLRGDSVVLAKFNDILYTPQAKHDLQGQIMWILLTGHTMKEMARTTCEQIKKEREGSVIFDIKKSPNKDLQSGGSVRRFNKDE